MSRQRTIRRAQRKADTKGAKINAAEVSRVASLILDDVEQGMEKLFIGIYWDFYHTKEGEAAGNKVLRLTRKLRELVARARNRTKKKKG